MKETNDYRSRLTALREEQQRLERKQAELLEKRRAEIGKLVEKLGLLEADDDTLAGALLDLKDAISKTGDERLARWRADRRRISPQRQRPQSCCAARGRWCGAIRFGCGASLTPNAGSIPGTRSSSAASSSRPASTAKRPP